MKHRIGINLVMAVLFALFTLNSAELKAQSCPAVPGIHTIVWTLTMPSGNFPEALTSVSWSVQNASNGFASSCAIVDQNFTYNSANGVFTVNVPDICDVCPSAEAFDIETGDIVNVTVTGTFTGENPATSSFSVTVDLNQSPVQSAGDVTLPVELSAFEAVGGDGLVLIKWTTESEIDNLGFHLYRSASESGQFTRITKDIIEGAGTSTVRNNYDYLDRNVENGKTYYYKLEDVDLSGRTRQHGPVSATPDAGKVIDGVEQVPTKFNLYQNFPNPFNPGTQIQYDIPEASLVTLEIYNLLGQKIKTLVNREQVAKTYSVSWNGLDDAGRQVASGIYIYTVKAGSFTATKKMLYMR